MIKSICIRADKAFALQTHVFGIEEDGQEREVAVSGLRIETGFSPGPEEYEAGLIYVWLRMRLEQVRIGQPEPTKADE